MRGEIVADGLVFPEGPVWHEGSVYFVEIGAGQLARFRPDRGVERFAQTAGGPNGAALGPDQALYVTQNGGMRREDRTTPGIQRVTLSGEVSMVTREIAGLTLEGPNDLAFGPDGRLYFTDPRGASDPTKNDKPGRLFVWDLKRGRGELILELGPVFPNGIAFDAQGTLLWSESFSRRVMALRDGRAELVIQLPERHYPDGFCVDADGRLYVASTYAHCVSVIEGGQIVERYQCGDGMPTNCCFAGTDLIVTESRHGTLWRFPVGRPGLALRLGLHE
ncbi:MAG TPA: SMP-30/gluconolactonase/LRE family protein [Polyangiales bacterium]|nr:SMP-30/gluconolactonase/LRE family protein [Polyangiales bacterium]